MDESWALSVTLAIAITAIFAGVGFNRPSWARSYTTALRYRCALAAHTVLYTLLLLVVYLVLQRVVALAGGEDTLSRTAIVWLALGLTLCLRGLPQFSVRARAVLQRVSGVPETARRLAKSLADAEFHVEPRLEEETRTVLLRSGIDVQRDWLPIARPVYRLLEKTTSLFLELRRWETDPRLADFLHEARHDFDRLRERFDHLSLRVSRTLIAIERLAEIKHLMSQQPTGAEGNAPEAAQADDLVRRLVSDMIADACEDISGFHRDACTITARGVLTTERSFKRRNAAVQRMGFQGKPNEPPVSYGVALVFTAAVLYVGCWIFFLLLPSLPSTAISIGARVFIVTLNVIGAMAIAAIPKRIWGFATAGIRRKAPIPFVIGAGLGAVAFATLVNLAAGAILIGGWEGALKRLAESGIYLVSTFCTGSTMAWLVQDHRWSEIGSSRKRRLFDAVTLGSVWVATTLVAQLWLGGPAVLASFTTVVILAAAFAFGGLLAFILPESVRFEVPPRLVNVSAVSIAQAAIPSVRSAARPSGPVPTQLVA